MIKLKRHNFADMRNLIGYVICRKTNVVVGSAILYKETKKTYAFIWGFQDSSDGLVPRFVSKRKDSYKFCDTVQAVHDYYTELTNSELKWCSKDYHLIDSQLLTLI